MATRLYLQSTGSAPFTPAAADGGWERDASVHAARRTSTAKWNSALTTLSALFGATTTDQTRFGTWVSPPLNVAQTISGTVSLVVGKCAETTTNGDAHLAYAIRVVTGAGVHRATLATSMTTGTEFPLVAAAATRIFSAVAVSSFAANAGDRLVIELGIHGVTPANETMQMRVGDPTGTADFALTAALTTDLDPWVELSQTITFGAPAGPTLADGRGATTVTAAAKRLLPALLAAGLATASVTASKISPPVGASTASASGQTTTTAAIGRRKPAATSAGGTSTATAGLHATRRVTVSTSGSGQTTVTLTAKRLASTNASGSASTTASLTRKRLGAAGAATGTSTTTAGLHAKRIANTSVSASASATVSASAIRRAVASAGGQATASVTLTKVIAGRTATASGTSTASVTASRIRNVTTSASGTSTSTAALHAKRAGSASAAGSATATATLSVANAPRSVSAVGQSSAVAILGRLNSDPITVSGGALSADAGHTGLVLDNNTTAMTNDAGATGLTPD